MQDDAPSVKVLKARIRSLEGKQRVVARDLTDRDPNRDDTLSRQLGSYQQLERGGRFAGAGYQHCLAILGNRRSRRPVDPRSFLRMPHIPPPPRLAASERAG